MATKKKQKKFSAVKAVKAAAREQVGTPPPTRAAPDEKTKSMRKQHKHKATLSKLLTEE
ncbi:MAG TPA: hypothetical protein VN622_05220 [Clostridia bacterium]|nr:hypothetical protein [Clostridia bacterium]